LQLGLGGQPLARRKDADLNLLLQVVGYLPIKRAEYCVPPDISHPSKWGDWTGGISLAIYISCRSVPQSAEVISEEDFKDSGAGADLGL
jgi:hypothetical protein